jgi:hypothetical protein
MTQATAAAIRSESEKGPPKISRRKISRRLAFVLLQDALSLPTSASLIDAPSPEQLARVKARSAAM